MKRPIHVLVTIRHGRRWEWLAWSPNGAPLARSVRDYGSRREAVTGLLRFVNAVQDSDMADVVRELEDQR